MIKAIRSFLSSLKLPSAKHNVPATPSSFLYAACLPNPYPLYAAARSINPVCFDKSDNSWIVLSYERVLWALKNTEHFSNQYSAAFDPFLVGSDGMAHAKTRKAFTSLIARFQPLTIAAFTEKWMDSFFNQIKGRTEFDAVGDLAIPLPRDFTADLLGLTSEEKNNIIQVLAPRRTDMNSALQPVGELLLSIMKHIREEPREGVISALIHSKSEEPLAWDEIMSTARHLWFAGTVTLTGLIPAAILQLCQLPDSRARLQSEPDKMPSFISEVLRLEAPTQFVPRMAVGEISVEGVKIPPHAMVRLGLASANRDPVVFPDPDVLNLDRPPNRHLSFGLGEHFCLGATIAKTIAAVVLQRIVNELPKARLAKIDSGLAFEKSPIFRALVSLPILKG